MSVKKPEVFFGANKTEKFFLDGKKEQFIEYKRLNDGEMADYEDSINSQIILNQETKEAKMESHLGRDRAALLSVAVVGYRVYEQKSDGDVVLVEGYDKSKWESLRKTMSAGMANELHKKIVEFNDLKKKD